MIDRSEAGDQLVAELRAGGDRAAIERRLFDHYCPAIFSFFTRRGFSRDESKDLAQETFSRAFAKLPGFRGECALKSWLLRIAGNVWCNAVRDRHAAKRHAPEVSIDELAEERVRVASTPSGWSMEPASPLEELLGRERSRRLRGAIGELPAQMRRCLQLRLDRELKYEEIGALLGISTGTVKAHLFQARQKLRDTLGEHERAAGP